MSNHSEPTVRSASEDRLPSFRPDDAEALCLQLGQRAPLERHDPVEARVAHRQLERGVVRPVASQPGDLLPDVEEAAGAPKALVYDQEARHVRRTARLDDRPELIAAEIG